MFKWHIDCDLIKENQAEVMWGAAAGNQATNQTSHNSRSIISVTLKSSNFPNVGFIKVFIFAVLVYDSANLSISCLQTLTIQFLLNEFAFGSSTWKEFWSFY